MPNSFKKNSKFIIFKILLAISLSLLLLPIELKSCPFGYDIIGPVLVKGKIYGIKIYQFQRNHFFRYIGLKKKDIIIEVNDNKISELSTAEMLKDLKRDFLKNKYLKLKILRKKSTFTIEFVLNPKNISKIKYDNCDVFGYRIDQSIPKKEMFDFYEIRKIE